MKPIGKSNRKFEDVLIRIKDEIILRKLQPGDKLMPEREMAEVLQVSRTSVREALRILEIFDVIQSKPGEGTTIKKPEVAKLLANFYPFVLMPTTTLVELLETRKIIEGGVAQLAAERRKPEDIKKMSAALDLMKSDNLENQMKGELDFHTSMSHAAYNKTLSDVLFVLSDLFSNTLQVNRLHMYQIPDIKEEMHKQHEKVLTAITDGDGPKAKQTLEYSLNYAIELFRAANSSRVN